MRLAPAAAVVLTLALAACAPAPEPAGPRLTPEPAAPPAEAPRAEPAPADTASRGEVRATATTTVRLASPPRVGDPAPDFELPDQDGKPWRLSTARAGHWVVLAFYPKAATPG